MDYDKVPVEVRCPVCKEVVHTTLDKYFEKDTPCACLPDEVTPRLVRAIIKAGG